MKRLIKRNIICITVVLCITLMSFVYVASAGGIDLNISFSDDTSGINLTWSSPNKDSSWLYLIQAKNGDGKSEWQTISPMCDGRKVQVLNVIAPTDETITYSIDKNEENDVSIPATAFLKEWMEAPIPEEEKPLGYGEGLITVTPVNINDLNDNPTEWMKDDEFGTWKYDVVVLTLAPYNGGVALTSDAMDTLEAFARAGGGVLTGPGFFIGEYETLIEDEGIARYCGQARETHNRISDLFEQPFEWFAVNAEGKEPGENPDKIALKEGGSTATVVCGFDRPDASAEDKVLMAETIIYLCQRIHDKEFTDTSFAKDAASPLVPIITEVKRDDTSGAVCVTVNAFDRGTPYKYRIVATNGSGIEVVSDKKSYTVMSDIKGYSIVIDNIEDTVPDDEIDVTSGVWNSGYVPDGNFYIHAKAIDNAGNASKTVHALNRMSFNIEIKESAEKAQLSWKTPVAGYDWEYRIERKNGLEWIEAGTTEETEYTDNDTQDSAPPKMPEVILQRDEDGTLTIELSCEDAGTEYLYRAVAACPAGEITSCEMPVAITNGVAGYSIEVDENPETIPDNTQEAAYGEAYASPYNPGKRDCYIHIIAFDNAGNESEVTHYYVPSDDSIKNKVETDVSLFSDFKINPNEPDPNKRFISKGITITSKSNVPVKVYLNAVYEKDGSPKIVSPNKFTDEEWHTLGARDTRNNIALGLIGAQTGSFWFKPAGQQKRVFLGSLDPGETMHLNYQAKYGLSWQSHVNLAYEINIAIEADAAGEQTQIIRP